jgi:outer membrane protein
MPARSRAVGAASALRPALLSCTLCLVAGCAVADFARSPPVPADVTPESVRARIVPPATLDTVETSDQPATAEPGKVTTAAFLTKVPKTTPVVASFAAEAPQPAEALSLPQAIDFGVQNNPRLAAALAAIDRARGDVDVAFSPFLPEVDLLTHEGITSPTLGPASAGTSGIILPSGQGTHTYAQAELQLEWILYDFGRTAGHYHQAQARERISELQSQRARETVGFDVASAYLLSLRAEATRVIQEESIRRAEATLRDTRSRRAAGVLEKDDVLRNEVQLAAAEEDLDIARQTELTNVAQLNNAMGRNASLPVRLIAWKTEPPFSLTLQQCLEIAANQRAEIAVAREMVAAAQFGRESVQGEYLPKVYARGSAGVVGGSFIQTGPQEGIGLHIDMPLYTGGRRSGALCAADAEIRQTLAQARSVLDEVTLQVTVAYLAATTARRRIERDRPAIVEAIENLRLVSNRYRNGQATPTDVVDAEVALTRAQQRLVSATYEYLGALVGLDYALENSPASLLGPADVPDAKAGPAPIVNPEAPAPVPNETPKNLEMPGGPALPPPAPAAGSP